MQMRACAFVVVAMVGCGGGSQSTPTTATIGPLGGVVQVPGGPTLAIVPDALAANTLITVRPRASGLPGAISTVYDFEPQGLSFARPATLSIPVDSSVTAAAIVLSSSGSAERLPALVAHGLASAQITHLASGHAEPSEGRTRTVKGQISTVYWADDGSKTILPGSLGPARTVPALWIPAGNNYRRVAVSFGADSSFSVPDVPEGPYFLEVDTQWDPAWRWADLFELTESTPDLSTVVTARPDVQIAAKPTSFTLDVLGLTPWVKSFGDMLLFTGSQAHVYGRPLAGAGAAPPSAGATSWHATWDWNRMNTAGAIGLPDASKGDVEFFYQRSTSPVGSGATQGVAHVATRFQRLDNLTLHDGVAGSASLTLADAPMTGSLRANLRNSSWASLLADANPIARFPRSAWAGRQHFARLDQGARVAGRGLRHRRLWPVPRPVVEGGAICALYGDRGRAPARHLDALYGAGDLYFIRKDARR
jgi:hypothetical protein